MRHIWCSLACVALMLSHLLVSRLCRSASRSPLPMASPLATLTASRHIPGLSPPCQAQPPANERTHLPPKGARCRLLATHAMDACTAEPVSTPPRLDPALYRRHGRGPTARIRPQPLSPTPGTPRPNHLPFSRSRPSPLPPLPPTLSPPPAACTLSLPPSSLPIPVLPSLSWVDDVHKAELRNGECSPHRCPRHLCRQ